MRAGPEQAGKTPRMADASCKDVAKGSARTFDAPVAQQAGHRGAAVGRLTAPDHCVYGLPGKITR